MEISEIRLFKDPSSSFIYYHEKNPFSLWHNHPEYEFCYIKKGEGIRTIGDHIDRFVGGDIVLLGPYLPHEWKCDQHYYDKKGMFTGEGFAVQFQEDFIGGKFFSLPENAKLKKCLNDASLGCLFYGELKEKIIECILEMLHSDITGRLYKLFSIFNLLAEVDDYKLLSSPSFLEPYLKNENEGWDKAIQYILLNFQKNIKLQDLLELTNMGSTTFLESFKKHYRMPFKRYLINIRIGYACRLLADDALNISQIAFESGFENLSNFNRQFKTLKGVTPREYKKHILGIG